jgi:hypothetical protein
VRAPSAATTCVSSASPLSPSTACTCSAGACADTQPRRSVPPVEIFFAVLRTARGAQAIITLYHRCRPAAPPPRMCRGPHRREAQAGQIHLQQQRNGRMCSRVRGLAHEPIAVTAQASRRVTLNTTSTRRIAATTSPSLPYTPLLVELLACTWPLEGRRNFPGSPRRGIFRLGYDKVDYLCEA